MKECMETDKIKKRYPFLNTFSFAQNSGNCILFSPILL